MIAITDTGAGMTDEVKSRLFEPFFTTKPQGEGTGLGLSMCYGIAKQIGGHIGVYSEVGHGTTFKIFLPRVSAIPSAPAAPSERILKEAPTRGSEAILLVEDDDGLRDLAGIVLRKLGYTVHEAANGVEAMSIAENHAEIALLLTDVVMPQMSGKELADRLSSARPAMKVLFTSAYTEDAILHHGILDPGIDFLHKPYTPALLSRKARAALDGSRTR
jgi:two-component system, cell cycle sensor histidine kinase and response regulator CckA